MVVPLSVDLEPTRFYHLDFGRCRDLAACGTALSWILTTRQWLWEDAVLQKSLHVPLRRGFGSPGPEEPAGVCLVRVKLCLDEVTKVVLVVIRKVGDCTAVLSIAAADMVTVRKGAVVTCAFTKAVEPFGATIPCQS